MDAGEVCPQRGPLAPLVIERARLGAEPGAPVLPHDRARRRALIAAAAPHHAAEAVVAAARTPSRAACNAASLVWSSEVFITVPPSPRRPSSTLSAVARRTSTNSAAVPGLIAAAVSFIHLSLMPTSASAPLMAPEAPPMAAPANGMRN